MSIARESSAESVDWRKLIPATGLKEYWYPALSDKKVGRKPVGFKICDTDLVFFRGKDGQVKCLWNVCPHRGGSLMHGDCHFPGTISCPYHGWTFDGDGNVLAVLPEGPESKIPGQVRTRAFPTQTHRGVVFVWMGDGEPADIQDDVPLEFFDPQYHLLVTWREWPINWMKGLENSQDAHVFYVHRDSFTQLLNPVPGARGPEEAIGGRPVYFWNGIGTKRAHPRNYIEKGEPYQVEHPGLGKWPKHHWRLTWSWLLRWQRARQARAPLVVTDVERWGTGHRLPGMYRTFNRVHMYTRQMVPIDAETTRVAYFHATRPRNRLGRWYETAQYHLYHKWAMYDNFSVQDMAAMSPQRYDTSEFLSPTDSPVIAWRRFVATQARGLVGRAEPGDQSEGSVSNSVSSVDAVLGKERR